jgi:uncharacterized protein
MTTLGRESLSDAELDVLTAFLDGLKNPDALNLEGLDGFFSALIAGPTQVMPSVDLPVIWGGELADENAFADLDAANETLSLIMRHWNSLIAELEADGVHVPLVDDVGIDGVVGRAWARGFMRGVRLAPAGWTELLTAEDEGQLLAIPLVAGEMDPAWPREPLKREKNDELIAWMGAGLARAYRHFAAARRRGMQAGIKVSTVRRHGEKIGRNDPCPCGSGRKYKQCCGGATDTVQ